jgi:hypothetical protein
MERGVALKGDARISLPSFLDDEWNWIDQSTLLPLAECGPCHVPSVKKKWRLLQQATDIPQGRCSHTLTPIHDCCAVLIAGGYCQGPNEEFTFLDDVWILNALNARWKQMHPKIRPPMRHESPTSHWGMPFGPPRRSHVTCYYPDKDYLIVFGGIADGDTRLNDVWVLHLAEMQWRKLESAPGPNAPLPRRAGVAFIDKDYFYVLGGDTPTPEDECVLHRLGKLSDDVTQWNWSIQPMVAGPVLFKRTPTWPVMTLSSRAMHTLMMSAATMIGRKLWMFGGLEYHPGQGLAPTHLLYRLDLDNWEFSVIHAPKNAPCPRFLHGFASVGRFLVVTGGIGNLRDQPLVADIAANEHDDDNDDEEANDAGMLIRRQRTIFDFFFFDTDALTWKQEHPNTIPGPWPSAVNAMGFCKLGNHLILYGGGVFPSQYFSSTYALELQLPMHPIKPVSCEPAMNDVVSDLGELYRTGLLSDVTFNVGEPGCSRKFHVHKVILASRCQFFETMFNGPYAESSAKVISLPGAVPDAVDLVLRFFYTGSVDTESFLMEDTFTVSSVMSLVDMWGVTKLSGVLEDALTYAMRRGRIDAVHLIAFAKAHNCKRLTLQALKFCKQKGRTPEYAGVSLEDADAEVMAEIEAFSKSLL